jgi:UDP-glucose 4-epimerase
MGAVKGAALRLANVYGPGPASSSADRGILNQMVRKALKGETLRIYGKGDFLRDYVYVEDVARAFALAADHVDAVNGKHFVISTGTGHTLAQAVRLVAERVAARTGRQALVEHVAPPASLSPIDTRNFVGDPSAFARATGWRPSVSLQEGIDRTIDFFLANKDVQ